MPHALVTGGAGFIGSHLVDSLLATGWSVTDFESFDPFYDVSIKERNVASHLRHPQYRLVRGDLRDAAAMRASLESRYDVVVHLAAKAGVRPSIDDPTAYTEVNVAGTQNLLELARACGVRQFVFASSSSVYGVNPRVPWREDDEVLRPISPYASTNSAASFSVTCTATCTTCERRAALLHGVRPAAASRSRDSQVRAHDAQGITRAGR